MYNIYLAGIVLVIFFVMADIDTYESYIIQEVGVFWGTTISKIINSFILFFAWKIQIKCLAIWNKGGWLFAPNNDRIGIWWQ